MAFIKRFLDFYINSSIHVALAVLSFCFLTAFELDLKLSIYFYISVFCASVSGYNFVKYFGLAKFYYRSLTTKLKYIQTVSLLSGIGFLYAFFMLRTPSQLLLIFLGFITFLYAIPLGIKTPRNLRSIGGVKIYIIAIVWGGTSVILPLLEAQSILVLDHLLILFQRIFILIVLMLPFEIRDLKLDEAYLSTIPHKIGIKNTKLIGCALLVDSFILEILKHQLNRESCLVLVFTLTVLAVLLVMSTSRRSRYYTSFIVESVPIMALILIRLLN
ncbi:hypothetical protein OAN36_02000 [Flavobacteriaceae bacterium]|nr:hypothetical protein [Flavobacteriaceae bacterium]